MQFGDGTQSMTATHTVNEADKEGLVIDDLGSDIDEEFGRSSKNLS